MNDHLTKDFEFRFFYLNKTHQTSVQHNLLFETI